MGAWVVHGEGEPAPVRSRAQGPDVRDSRIGRLDPALKMQRNEAKQATLERCGYAAQSVVTRRTGSIENRDQSHPVAAAGLRSDFSRQGHRPVRSVRRRKRRNQPDRAPESCEIAPTGRAARPPIWRRGAGLHQLTRTRSSPSHPPSSCAAARARSSAGWRRSRSPSRRSGDPSRFQRAAIPSRANAPGSARARRAG